MAILGVVRIPQKIQKMILPKRRSISKITRQKVFDKCNGHCGYCGHELGERWCVDHMHAHYLGGTDDFDNLMPACQPCNLRKMASSVEGFRREMAEQVARARKSSVNFRFAERFGLIAVNEKPVVFYFESLLSTTTEPKE